MISPKKGFTKIAFALALPVCASLSLTANANDKFYANPSIQQQAPQAFVLQQPNQQFLALTQTKTIADADKLLALMAQDKVVSTALQNWDTLSLEQQIPLLRQIFELEVASFGIKPPKLVIDNHSYPGKMVYFDFKLTDRDNGTVYLNPDKLASQPQYAALAFLLHETRHAYQLQLAMRPNQTQANPVFSRSYKASFTAQKQIKGMGFSDFLTLSNEYEAFLFGNYMIGRITNWQVDMIGMGTYASQFDSQGKLKMDLAKLATTESDLSLLEQYNQLAKAQFDARRASK
ncbi:hypothetical protein G3R49_00055 [Shewanella sp. WXL01]|uniref:hypothetical protein n=1 Tax=Shewanella sp. WXL01 TaxID=2709721 RepID=UPI0014382FA9|nr:hypothetical protein [Shewanella sp. WXL01]NKF48966.1 hypothetical protein [Shewanella sp. WXL01]